MNLLRKADPGYLRKRTGQPRKKLSSFGIEFGYNHSKVQLGRFSCIPAPVGDTLVELSPQEMLL